MAQGGREAGSVTGYSNQTLETFVEALSQFANPKHPEKTLEELQRLYAHIQASPMGERTPTEIRVHNVERRLGPERVTALVARYEGGVPAEAVAKEFDVAVSTVLRLVRRAGRMVRQQPPSAELLRDAVRLYESGLSLQRLVDRLGVSKSTLRRYLADAGVMMRPAIKQRGPHHRDESDQRPK